MKAPRIVLALLALGAALPGQEQATTLELACRTADVIVVATVTRASDPSPDWHRLEWRADAVLAGSCGATFALLEPAGACCGRSLFALTDGAQRLLFLRRTGALLHPFGGSRGVVPATPALLQHVRALLAAPTTAARAALLAGSLASTEPRIAADAAHGLAAMRDLELGPVDRRRVTEALRRAVARGQTTAASLIEVAVRCADEQVLDAVLPVYLAEPNENCAAMLRAGLLRVRGDLVTTRLPLHLGRDRDRELRAAQLLRASRGALRDGAMRSLLARTRCPRVKLAITEGMLETGVPLATLRRDVPAPILDLAARRAGQVRLRAVHPRQSRRR